MSFSWVRSLVTLVHLKSYTAPFHFILLNFTYYYYFYFYFFFTFPNTPRLRFLSNFLPFLIVRLKPFRVVLMFLTHSFRIYNPTFPLTFPPCPKIDLFFLSSRPSAHMLQARCNLALQMSETRFDIMTIYLYLRAKTTNTAAIISSLPATRCCSLIVTIWLLLLQQQQCEGVFFFLWEFLSFITCFITAGGPMGFLLNAAAYVWAGTLPANKILEVLWSCHGVDCNLTAR